MVSATSLVDAVEKAGAMDAPLKERLAALADWHRELFPETATAYDRLIQRLTAVSSGATAPGVGQKMPSFVLPDHDGHFVTLDEILQSGPAVISFNRGHWCIFCKLELFSLAEKQAELDKLGAQAVSIVPDTQAFARKFKEVSDLPFNMLTDIDNGYALTLGLVIWLGEEVRLIFGKRGIDITEFQGNHSWFVPIPATFVVGQDGVIIARFVDPNFRERMEIDQIFEALRKTS